MEGRGNKNQTRTKLEATAAKKEARASEEAAPCGASGALAKEDRVHDPTDYVRGLQGYKEKKRWLDNGSKKST